MTESTMDQELQPMTLGTIADGELESQFQERLHSCLDALRDFRRLSPQSDGTYRCVIPLEIAIVFDPGDATYKHSARALQPKTPKPKALERAAYRRGDDLKVLPDWIQPNLIAPVTVIGDAKTDES